MKQLNKLQLTIITSLAVLLIVLGMFLYMRQITTVLSSSTVATMHEIAAHDKSFIESYLERMTDNLINIGTRMRNSRYNSITELQQKLSVELGTSPFRYLYLIDSQGKMYSGAYLIQDGNKYPYVNNILKKLPKTIDHYSESLAVDSQDETIVYALSMPPFKVGGEEFVGIVGQTIVNDVRKHMTANSFGNQGHSLVVDREGYYIVNYSYKNGIGQQDNLFNNLTQAHFDSGHSLEQVKKDIKQGKAFECSYQLEGVPHNLIVLPFDNVNWSLAITVPSSVFISQSRQFTLITTILLLSIVLILLCLVAGIFRAWKLSIETRALAEAKSSFLNKMSHEIRTPLNAIIGLNYLMKEKLDDKAALTQYLDKTSDTSQYLLSLVNDILDLSKLEQSHIIMANEAFSLTEMVELLADIMKEELAKKQLTFTITNKLSYPFIMGDELRLKQVVLNLLSNAIKFTNEKGTITLELAQIDQGNKQVINIVKVADNGIGMSEEFQKHVFESFAQENRAEIDPTVHNGNRGSGLGLTISYLLMRNMKGNLQVQSTLGEGSCFTATWPALAVTEPARESAKIPSENTLPRTGNDTSLGKNILIAEDNSLNADILVQILQRRKYNTVVAVNGQEAVKKFAASQPNFYDVILMDVQMPIMNGYEAATKIRAMKRPDAHTTRIYACTANTAVEDRQKATAAGMNGFIAKPIDVKKLLAILQNI